jgi:aflatoxin B1 aldehyde reductase
MNLVLGTMNINYQYTSNINNTDDYYKQIIKAYIDCTDVPVLDTAYYYGNTKTEKILGNILSSINFKPLVATKANPWFENDFTTGKLGQLSPNNLERQLDTSLNNLKLKYVDIFFLHAPDHETPIEETLEKCDEMWRKEKFNYLGLSNYSKDQVIEILSLCDNKYYIKPKIYQGMYNLIARKVEELFPIIDDMEFWAYNPLAGGLLTGKYKSGLKEDSRFKDNQIYQNIFWKPEIIDSLSDFYKMDKNLEYALLWLRDHSKLRSKDKIILGVSTLEQLGTNMKILESNIQIEQTKLDILNNIYNKDFSPNYYY